MIKVLILICAVGTPPDKCDQDHAVSSSITASPFGIPGMGGQIEMADSALRPSESYYEKIVQLGR